MIGHIMSKKVKSIKHFICLLAVAVISISTVSAEVITSFPISNFWIVDNTQKTNPNNRAGYSDVIFRPSGDNAYHLTDTLTYQSIAMWSKKMINMAENWELHFELYFYTGGCANL